jgi:thiol-disulfide isomerase/thioredoxin
VSACGVSPQIPQTVSVDTPALRALKAAAHIEACPTTTAPATGQLGNKTLPCLGGGRSVVLGSLRGPMVVNLWAQSCVPCRTEMPYIEAFSKKFAGRVSVLGVDYGPQEDPGQALAFARTVGATYPMVADYIPVIQTAALPTTILIDVNGTIVYRQPGDFGSEAQLEQLVAQHLGVKP